MKPPGFAERELGVRIREQARLVGLAELLPRCARLQLRQVLDDDAHRELYRLPALRALARDRLLFDDLAQAGERHYADDRDDRHRHE